MPDVVVVVCRYQRQHAAPLALVQNALQESQCIHSAAYKRRSWRTLVLIRRLTAAGFVASAAYRSNGARAGADEAA